MMVAQIVYSCVDIDPIHPETCRLYSDRNIPCNQQKKLDISPALVHFHSILLHGINGDVSGILPEGSSF
jgi:hypothetical protein